MLVPLLVRKELLDRGEDHLTRLHRQLLSQIGSTLGLHRRLPQQIAAAREGAGELAVQVVAIGEDDQGSVSMAGSRTTRPD